VLDQLLEGCQIIGFDGTYIYVNDAVARHARRSKEELLGRRMVDVFPGVEQTVLFRTLTQCMAVRTLLEAEDEFVFPNGARGWFVLRFTPVPEGVLIFSEETTERKRTEERYRQLLENLDDVVYSVDTQGRITFVGPAIARYGYSVEELVGSLFHAVIHPEDLLAVAESFARTMGGEAHAVECRVVDKGGTPHVVRISGRVMREGGVPTGASGVLMDLTERKSLEELVRTQMREITESKIATILALAKLSESRDDDTGHHIERVRTFSRMLAEALRDLRGGGAEPNPEFVERVFQASPLHDIGKVAVPDAVLLKPGKLTPDEFEVMKTHAAIGARTLEAVYERYPHSAFIRMGADIARSHHEKWDGNGYPDRRRGDDIPLCARIVAVADVYDALRARRPYKDPFTHDKARDIIFAGSGSHFDPELVEAFRRVEAEFDDIRGRLSD
jgi:PAS domain S-box-containing protein